MYADDTTILCSSTDPLVLQSDLNNNFNKITKWFADNELTLNIKKTKLMIFSTIHKNARFKDISVSFNNNSIERVNLYKYLGVIFDPQLNWRDHIESLSLKVAKRIGVIRRVNYYIPPHTLKMLANALVIPLFDYCCCVWSNCKVYFSDSLQVLLNRLGRILLSVDIYTPVNDILNSLGWSRLNDKWNENILTLIFKCLKGNAPSYLSTKFIFTENSHNKGTRSQSNNTLLVPKWNILQGKRTFNYRSTKLWNSIPNHIKIELHDMTISTFKTVISKL